jgi:hypothetical protein
VWSAGQYDENDSSSLTVIYTAHRQRAGCHIHEYHASNPHCVLVQALSWGTGTIMGYRHYHGVQALSWGTGTIIVLSSHTTTECGVSFAVTVRVGVSVWVCVCVCVLCVPCGGGIKVSNLENPG